MESVVKNVRYMRHILMTQPTAADLWWIAISILAGFDRHIPWWMWVVAGIEQLIAFHRVAKAHEEDEDDDE